MHDDINHRGAVPGSGQPSITRRREILRRIGKASVLAGAATPMAALATGSPRHWCKHPVDTTKCVHASISGMGSVVLSAQASNEVKSRKCSYYATGGWTGGCSSTTKFATAFGCAANTSDSGSPPRPRYISGSENPNCLLNMSVQTLCSSQASTVEAHWATALGNAYNPSVPASGAPFPYTPAEVVALFSDLSRKDAAYAFFSQYCETY